MSKSTLVTAPKTLQNIAKRLEDFIDRYPDDELTLKHIFISLTDRKFSIVHGSKHTSNDAFYTQTHFTLENATLIEKQQQDFSLYHFLNGFIPRRDDMDTPETYNRWNKKFRSLEEWISSGQGYKFVKQFYRIDIQDGWNDFSGKRTLYDHHKLVFDRVQAVDALNIADVHHAIEEMKNGQVPSILQDQKTSLPTIQDIQNHIEIPSITDDEISKMVASVEPNSYGDIASFGLSLTLEFSKALRQVSAYFIQHAARAAQTMDRAEQIITEVHTMDSSAIVPSMPSDWDRLKGRLIGVSLVDASKSPFNTVTELAKDLPDLAQIDSELYAKDLELAEHAIKLCTAYAGIVERMKAIFEKDKSRIVPSSNGNTAEEFALAGIPENFEKTVDALGVKVAFLNNQAGSFGIIAARLADTQRNLGGAAILSQAVQTPALNAIHLFNVYQAKRFQTFGRTVNEGILKQLDLNKDALKGRGTLSEEDVKNTLALAGQAIQGQIGSLVTLLTQDMSERVKIAEQIESDLVNEALGQNSQSLKLA